MPKLRNTVLKIRVVDPQGNFLGGTVDLELRHGAFRDHLAERELDASRAIRVRGLRRRGSGDYRVTVTPAGFAPQSLRVGIPPNGIAELDFVFPPAASADRPRLPARDDDYIIIGRVFSPDQADVVGLRVQIVDKNVGKDIIIAQATTDERGNYMARFSARYLGRLRKSAPDLQARVFKKETFLGASEVRYNASIREQLDVRLAAQTEGLATEHEALTGAIAAHYQGELRDLQESDERQDLTYLANKTGWDARAVALAALADRFSQFRVGGDGEGDGEGLDPVLYYALFRAGLPANPDTLYQADAATVNRVWKSAIDQGLVPKALEKQLPSATQVFQELSADRLLTAPAPAGVSSLQDMLATARLDEQEQQQFAELYAAKRTNLPEFWKAVSESLGSEVSDRLQATGKVAFLTLNNAPLIAKLDEVAGDNGLSDPVQLADAGLYRSENWDELLGDGIEVPEQIPGQTAGTKQRNYSEYLAAQIRLSYPTAAVAQMVQAGDLAVKVPDKVHKFLKDHHGEFEIGVQPVEQFIARKNLRVAAKTVAQVKRLQRVYQITPSDQAMSSLLAGGVDSAYQVMRYDKDAFVRSFASDLGGEEQAIQTYHKSAQVYNAVLNVAVSYLTARNGIALGSTPSAAADARSPAAADGPSNGGRQVLRPIPRGPQAAGDDVIAYPTLEGLFGSMDFCACEHCRSILSPAAYLVDLLHFLDQPAPRAGTENPQTILLERRPDIEHLPLTCENTNTALPYIDVVNETLEYFISNDVQKFSLDGYEGFDTGEAESADLLASPQFVEDAAYDTLRAKHFPDPLPFHQPLESLRRYFDKFEVPLTLAMERFRKHDKLEHGAAPYGWRDILMEKVGLSRPEYEILTDSTSVPLWRMFGFPNGTSDGDVIAELSNAKQFARRLDVSYEDLVSILKTRFVNPDSNLIPKLERLGVSFAALAALQDGSITGAEFDALLPVGAGAPDPANYGGDIKNWVTDNANFARIMGLIVLTDPSGDPDPCKFDNLEFRHAQPTADASDTSTRLGAPEFVRILRLMRLWKKTGWTIEQTDDAICALFNADLSAAIEVDTLAKLDTGFLTLLPRLGILLSVMDALNMTAKRDLLPLLTVWSPIGTHGEKALYRQMFLNPALLEQDDVFADNGVGEFLQDNTKKLLDHTEALRSAFNLTGDEFDRIIAALGFDANTELNIANISAIFRRGWLARELSLSIRELLLLTQLTGLDPFAAPDPTSPAILRLVALVKSLKERSLKTAVALYLIWNQDLSGKSAPDPAQVMELARTLRGDFAAIEDQFAVSDDPSGSVARTRMELVYGTEAAATFFSLLEDTLALDVPYTHHRPKLKKAITDTDPKIAYDHFRHRLSSTGIFTKARRNALRGVPGVRQDFKDAVNELFDHSEDVTGSFFARYPELQPLYDAFVASNDPVETKYRQLLAGFRPELSRRRKRQQALQRLTAAVGVDLSFTETIVDGAAGPYPLHAKVRPNRPALNDVLSLEKPGLAARFFFRNTATGTVDLEEPAVAHLSYSPQGRNSLPPHPTAGRSISGLWRGRIEAPEDGFVNFVIEADGSAKPKLRLGGQLRPLTQHGRIWRNTDPIELTAGTMYEIAVTVERVRDRVSIMWETPTRPREVIPGRYLYPPGILSTFSQAYTRFVKTASLAVGLKMTADEIAHFATDRDYEVRGEGFLNALAVTRSPTAATAAALLAPLEALLAFSAMKAELSPEDESLLEILQDPATATADADSLLFTLTRWDEKSLDEVAVYFKGDIAELKSFEFFRRVFDAFTLVRKMGVGGGALIAATTNEPTGDTVRDLQANLRARYDPADWRDVVQPINDEVRGLQRDALVAYILHHLRSRPATKHIDTPEKLFEHFLMDVQMEPCMQTSRIRHALSTVQLFIERCLMNLEPRIAPDSLNAQQWEWMKRYRVWEANRKVFLFPENWLEPELRDDKSPFFKELESELLQSDITEEAAASAYLNYLTKLEEVAKLQPCGIYHLEGDPSRRTGDVDHVIARTPGANRKYFYRRRDGGTWTPWEPIKLDIEDNPVIPVVWNNRLLLFWLKLMKEGPTATDKPPASTTTKLTDLTTSDIPDDPQIAIKAVLVWSEYYNGKWQPTKSSEVEDPTVLSQAQAPVGLAGFRRSLTHVASEEDEALYIGVNGMHYSSLLASFVLHNTNSPPEDGDTMTAPYLIPGPRTAEMDHGKFIVTYYSSAPPLHRTVLQPKLSREAAPRVVDPLHPMSQPFVAPFFVDDRRHTFFVRTKQKPVRIWEYLDILVAADPGPTQTVEIPPFVVEALPETIGPQFWGPAGPIGPVISLGDEELVQNFISEDANIHQGIGATGVVEYGDQQIGPSGAIDIHKGMK